MKRFVIGAMAVVAMTAAVAVAKMANVPDEECVKRSQVIVVGKVKEMITREKFPPDHEITIEVTKTLKGKAEGVVKLQMPGIARNSPPKVGEEKIFLLNPREGGKDYEMAVGATMFSVRDASELEKIEKLIAAEKPAK
jgi:hypothetical protein